MKHIDLFSGIGGFSLPARWMGWQTIAYVERDPFCQAVLRKNFGQDITLYDDIKNFTAKSFPDADIITCGFPCQPFSAAGRRLGARDDRYLWPEVVRVTDESNAPWGIFENVLGLSTMVFDVADSRVESLICDRQEDRDYFEKILTRTEIMQLGVCCKDLEEIGYSVQPFVIPACGVGAPHRRYRIWIVAHSESKRLGKERQAIERHPTERTARPSSGDDKHADSERRQGCKVPIQPRGSRAQKRDVKRPDIGTAADSERERLAIAEETGQPLGLQHAQRNDSQPVADAESVNNRIGLQQGKSVKDRRRPDDKNSNADTESDDARLQRGKRPRSSGKGSRASRSVAELSGHESGNDYREHREQWDEHWISVAARTCIQPAHDGVSGRVVRSAGWKSDADWRVKALMAAGNSVSPQVVYELYRAVQVAEYTEL